MDSCGGADIAAAYDYGIAKNHPFVDGNKRTAFVACRTFLILNGSDLVTSIEDKYLTFLRLSEGQLTEGELAVWIRRNLESVQLE